MPNSDLGVVLYASGDGTGSYVAPDGNAGSVRTLTANNWIASDWFDPGRFADLYVTISGIISVQLASVLVRLERQRRDATNAVFHTALIGSRRLDDPSAGELVEHTIARANLVGQNVSAWPNASPAVETLDVVLFTPNARWSGPCRILVKASNGPANADRIVVAINGGG